MLATEVAAAVGVDVDAGCGGDTAVEGDAAASVAVEDGGGAAATGPKLCWEA